MVRWCLRGDVLCFSQSCIIPPLEHLPWFPAVTDSRTGADCVIWTTLLGHCCGGAALEKVPHSFPYDVLWPGAPRTVNYAQWEEKVFLFILNLKISSDAISC